MRTLVAFEVSDTVRLNTGRIYNLKLERDHQPEVSITEVGLVFLPWE